MTGPTIRTDPAPELRAAALQAAARLRDRAVEASYRGWEFDDLLASRLVRLLSLGRNYPRRLWVQLGIRCPVNLRPALGVPRLPSTKASGFFARGYLELFRATGEPAWRDAANDRLAWLLGNPSPGYPGLAWGNHFDFASRGGFYPRRLPTVVWTAHIAEAFDLSASLQGDPANPTAEAHRDAVVQAGTFVLEALDRDEDAHGFCFGYAPGVMNRVHNSNLLGAGTLLRRYRITGERHCLELAARSIRWSLHRQNDDGSWAYGAGPHYRWIDNFHTAYVLESLKLAHDIAGEEVVPWRVVEDTYTFWAGHFFLDDGTPRFYHDRTHPIDIQCAAQAIETLSRLASTFPTAGPLADQVLGWTLTHMRKPNGAFRFRRLRHWTNELEPIHWGQATMLSALGAYAMHRGGP
jgi:hypothetical protein